MSDQTHAYCPECGCIDLAKQAMVEKLEEKEELTSHLTKELSKLRRTISAFRNDADERRRQSPFALDAREVFEYWQKKCSPGAREFGPTRFDAVVARLNGGASVEELKKAVDGCALRPFVGPGGMRVPTGSPEQRYVDLELICRDENKVARFAAIVDSEQVRLEASKAEVEEASRAGATAGAARAAAAKPSSRDGELALYQQGLTGQVLERLEVLRAWKPEVVKALGLGLNGPRITFPIYGADGALLGVHSYAPNPKTRTGPKMLADGQRDLFPRPESYATGVCWLVEGEPDAVAAISVGLQAVGVPGVGTWKAGWAHRFERFEHVVIAFDCDSQGREAAQARSRVLTSAGVPVTIVDLSPGRVDGFDVTDAILASGPEDAARALWALTEESATVHAIKMPSPPCVSSARVSPVEGVRAALEARGLRVSGGDSQLSAQCPAHEDRHASLSVGVGRDGRALLSCHAGCPSEAILSALGLVWGDLFEESA